jgi:hypothetical protein
MNPYGIYEEVVDEHIDDFLTEDLIIEYPEYVSSKRRFEYFAQRSNLIKHKYKIYKLPLLVSETRGLEQNTSGISNFDREDAPQQQEDSLLLQIDQPEVRLASQINLVTKDMFDYPYYPYY